MKRIQTKTQVTVTRRNAWFLFCTCALLFLLLTPGCGNKFFDPTQIGRFRPVPAVNVILDTLGVAEETPVAWEQAEDPQPADTVVRESDYVFRAGDIVRISIFELLQDGVPFVNDYVVTETGKLSIPEVGVVEVGGLTETQLEDEIRRILSPSILKEPSVVATLMSSQQRTFSILGDGVGTPSRYVIPRYDYRLADALATAGGVRQFNVSYIYVSRPAKGKEPVGELTLPKLEELELIEPEITTPEITTPRITKPQITKPEIIEPEQMVEPEQIVEPEQKILEEIITPRAQRQWPQSKVVIASSEMITDKELAQARATFPEGFEIVGRSRQNQNNVRSTPVSSVEPTAPEPTEEAIKDEPISVRDILKTLSQPSRRERTSATPTSPTKQVWETGAEPSGPQTTVEMPGDERIDVKDIPALPNRPSRQARIDESAGAREVVGPSTGTTPTDREKIAERAKVGDIKRLSEQRRPEKVDQETGLENVARPLPEPTVRERADEEPDIDKILKSLSERRRTERIKKVEEIVGPSEESVGPEKVNEQIDVDEILKTLDEGAGRERIIEKPVEQPSGIEETLKSLPELGAPEIPEEQIGIEEVAVPEISSPPVAPETIEREPGRIEWIFQDGKWVPMQVGPPAKPTEPIIKFEPNEELIVPLEEEKEKLVPELEWTEAAKTRLIRIPADKLLAGDPRYNIVIKPGDTIHVPVDIIGEFCIMGNVNNQGYVNVTGRPMTLKMAIAAAGGLGPLAWPKTCEVIRRIGKKKEEIVLVDLDKIANGEQPDFFIKPNDLINVGTHYSSRWRLILRNAFRATYGFGFVYDRNFADVDYYHRGLTTWF